MTQEKCNVDCKRCCWAAILAQQLGDAPFIRIPLRFFAFWSIDGLLACLVAGIVAGLVYKPAKS